MPELEYLNITELAAWLVLSEKTVRRLISKGILPAGKMRPDRKKPTWSRQDAAVAKWIVDNLERFAGGLEESVKENISG